MPAVTSVLTDANSMRDGGTTYVSLRMPTQSEVTYWFDYSLPWDGRVRQIRRVEGDESVVLPVGSPQEAWACHAVRAVLVAQFSERVVSQFVSGKVENPGEGVWFYAFNFLRLCVKEAKLHG